MPIRARLTDRETQIAEDMAAVLDMLSRVMQSLEGPVVNLHYGSEKAEALIERSERLALHLQAAHAQAGTEPAIRAAELRAAIAEFARHYHAGRTLYPLGSSPGTTSVGGR